MKELIEKVVQWGVDRGLDKVGHLPQAKYTLKETAELLDAYADGDIGAMNDAIGDILVTLIVGASNDEKCIKWFFDSEDDSIFVSKRKSEFDFTSSYIDLVFYASFLMKKCKFDTPSLGQYRDVVQRLEFVMWNINYEFNQDLSLKDCLELAYNEIKSRTGRMINGQFVKDQ